MLEFLETPKVEIVNDRTFKLIEDWPVKIEDFTVVVHAGFETDLASVPRVPVVYLLVGSRGHHAAILHDYLYSSKLVTRAEADAIYFEALRASGVNYILASMMYAGVRAGGGLHYGR